MKFGLYISLVLLVFVTIFFLIKNKQTEDVQEKVNDIDSQHAENHSVQVQKNIKVNEKADRDGIEAKEIVSMHPETQSEEGQKKLTRFEFERLASTVFGKLPTVERYRNSVGRDDSEARALLLASGKGLGEIAQAVKDNPELRQYAKPFYLDCAENRDLMTPARALCLSNYLRLMEEDGKKLDPYDLNVEEKVIKLSEKLSI